MKKNLLLISAFVITILTFGQTGNDYLEIARDVLKTEKKAVVAEALQLTTEESVPFWELYGEYQNALYLAQNKRIALIKDFADNYESLTPEKADELWIDHMKYQQEVLKLKRTYYSKFKKIIPVGKAARFMQVENKIETMINAQLALEIPLIETKE